MALQFHKSILAITFAFLLSACDAGPDAVAKDWLDALNAGQVTDAKKISTEQTQALIDMASAMGKSLAVGKYEIVDVRKISDTQAEVTFSTANKSKPQKLDLVRVDGDWKVAVRKS